MPRRFQVTSWSVIIGAVLLVLGCEREPRTVREQAAKGPATTPEVPNEPDKITKLWERGGEAWSSPTKVQGRNELNSWAAGVRFWIWPVEDGPYVMTEGYVHFKFHWRVRPGQKAPEPGSDKGFDNAILGQFRMLPDHKFVTRPSQPGFVNEGGGQRVTMEIGAESGTSTFRYDARQWQATGDGWIVFYLATRSGTPKEGIAALDPFEPCSNLLKLKLRFERPAEK